MTRAEMHRRRARLLRTMTDRTLARSLVELHKASGIPIADLRGERKRRGLTVIARGRREHDPLIRAALAGMLAAGATMAEAGARLGVSRQRAYTLAVEVRAFVTLAIQRSRP